jgi:hypothetical protein
VLLTSPPLSLFTSPLARPPTTPETTYVPPKPAPILACILGLLCRSLPNFGIADLEDLPPCPAPSPTLPDGPKVDDNGDDRDQGTDNDDGSYSPPSKRLKGDDRNGAGNDGGRNSGETVRAMCSGKNGGGPRVIAFGGGVQVDMIEDAKQVSTFLFLSLWKVSSC